MNDLVSMANDLKNLSDQQLQMVQRDQSVPPYLVVSEMKRRDDMRKAYQAMQQQPKPPTVAQQVVGQFQQGMRPPMPQGPPQAPPMPAQQQGLAALSQSPMGAFGRPPGMMPQGPPQGMPPAMRSGGIVAFADGGETDDEDESGDGGGLASLATADTPIVLPTRAEDFWKSIGMKPRTLDEKVAAANAMMKGLEGPDSLSGITDKISRLQAIMGNRRPSMGQSLMALGLGMAASRNPTFAGAIGEGGLGALQRYDQQREQDQRASMLLLAQEAELARAAQQRGEQRVRNVLGSVDREDARENTLANVLGAHQSVLAKAQLAKDQRLAPLTRVSLPEYNATIDTIADPNGKFTADLNRQTKQQVAIAFQRGDVKGIDDALKAARSQVGQIRVAQATVPSKIAVQVGAQEGKNDLNEADMQVAAQSLANYDMTAIRDISSLRGDQRLKLFAMAKRLNPDFNTSKVNRMIKMEDQFTNGKDGQNLQSFGQFLQHAGEASDITNTIRNTQSAYINRPINWWRQNMAGDPNFQAFMTSLEPVRKESESFLLGGRALYSEDRRAAETILSENSSPAQIQAALKQLGHTVKARYIEANHRYKRVMGHDLEDAISPEAAEGALKIGTDLSLSPNSSSPSSGDLSSVPTDELMRRLTGGK